MPRWMPRRRAPPAIPQRRIDLDGADSIDGVGGTDRSDRIDGVHELLASAPPEDLLHGRTPVTAPDAGIVKTPVGRCWYAMVESTHGRLVRGRAYLREGAVLDLQVQRGLITAEVQGTSRYRVKIAVSLPVGELQADLRQRMASAAGLTGVDLQDAILPFADTIVPPPRHIIPFCSCMDSTPFCKHVCAALHGFGVRLDSQPELLLLLRGLLPDGPPAPPGPLLTPLAPGKRLTGDLTEIFGIDIVASTSPGAEDPAQPGTPDPRDAAGPSSRPEVTREYLRTVGVPTHFIDAWLREGVLRRTHRHGIYERTAEADKRIAALMPGDDGTGGASGNPGTTGSSGSSSSSGSSGSSGSST